MTPENPGRQEVGAGRLRRRAARRHRPHLHLRYLRRGESDFGAARRRQRATIADGDRAPYPTQTGAAITANYYTAALPVGAGDIRYFVEAEDGRGTAPAALWNGCTWPKKLI